MKGSIRINSQHIYAELHTTGDYYTYHMRLTMQRPMHQMGGFPESWLKKGRKSRFAIDTVLKLVPVFLDEFKTIAVSYQKYILHSTHVLCEYLFDNILIKQAKWDRVLQKQTSPLIEKATWIGSYGAA